MRPGITKAITLTDAWQRLSTIYQAGQTEKIIEDGQVAAGAWVSIDTNGAQIAFADTTPLNQGHPVAADSAVNMENMDFVRRCWLKNDVAGNNAVAVVTPLFAT